jgi:hypothetical protein
MFEFHYFSDRTFAFGGGIYIGSWGVHIYLDFWRWCFMFESNPSKESQAEQRIPSDQDKV